MELHHFPSTAVVKVIFLQALSDKFLFETATIGILKDKPQCQFQSSKNLYIQMAQDMPRNLPAVTTSTVRGGILCLAAHEAPYHQLYLNGQSSTPLGPESLKTALTITQEEFLIIASCSTLAPGVFDSCRWIELVGQDCAGIIAPVMPLRITAGIPEVLNLAQQLANAPNRQSFIDVLWKFYKDGLTDGNTWRLGFLPLFNVAAFTNNVGVQFDIQEIAALKTICANLNVADAATKWAYREVCPYGAIPNDIQSMLDCLSQMECTQSKPLLFKFLELCKSYSSNQAIHRTLDTWEYNIAQRLEIDLCSIREQLPLPEDHKKMPTLMISFDKKNDFHIKAWLCCNNKPEPIAKEAWDKGYTWSELPKVVNTILNKACSCIFPTGQTSPLIELILPFDGVTEAQIQEIGNKWEILLGRIPELLVLKYLTVLRSRERIYEEDYAQCLLSLQQKWNLNRNATLQQASFYCECQNAIGQNLLHSNALIAVAFQEIAQKMGFIVAAGIPCALLVWQQKPQNLSTAAPLDCCQICGAIAGQQFDALPSIIHQQRQNPNTIWSKIMLLWDNPNALPPDTQIRLIQP